MTDHYIPEPPPEEYTSEYLYRELNRVSELLEIMLDGQIDRAYAPPIRPRDGMIRYADGTYWDPGIGRGIYYYDSTKSKWIPFA